MANINPIHLPWVEKYRPLTLKNIEGNKYLYLFLKVSILKQKSKYQYAYKFNEKRLRRQKIMLPINESGSPDYVFMEQYMYNLEFQKKKEYFKFESTLIK